MNHNDWHEQALCRQAAGDPRIYFAVKGGGVHLAKQICALCPFRRECLQEAMDFEGDLRYGVWGGLTPEERHELAKTVWAPLPLNIQVVHYAGCEHCGAQFERISDKRKHITVKHTSATAASGV